MAIIDTTGTLDTSMYLKAKLKNNMVGDNYYIENLQDKRNLDWEYRYNVVDIEEELNKDVKYTTNLPCYTPVEAVIQSVKDDKHNDLGTDWASLSFKDLYHPSEIGYRYRFDYGSSGEGMQILEHMTEEEKYYNTSIWLAINKSPISAGNSLVTRRCNGSIALVGSTTREYDNVSEVRYEPVIIDADSKLLAFYLNMTLVIPNAIWTMTAQLNYFTNQIRLNDRVILGGVTQDPNDKGSNEVYRVNGIIKVKNTKTFSKPGDDDVATTPLVVFGLDKDVVSSTDDFYYRIADRAPIYTIVEQNPSDFIPPNEYIIQVSEPENNRIILGDTITRTLTLDNSTGKTNFDFEISANLEGFASGDEGQEEYYEFEVLKDEQGYLNTFSIKNLKTYNDGYLVITAIANYVDSISGEEHSVTETFEYELGSFY